MNSAYHMPVLLRESVEALNIQSGGVYVDLTFGGGGHSAAILDKLDRNSRLYAFDQDPDAIDNIPADERFTIIPWNFRYIKKMLRASGVEKVDGVLADLGVSSWQLNNAERGFAYRSDAILDMRMDTRSPVTAASFLQDASREELQRVFSEYGELRNARQLSMAIVDHRKLQPISTTGQLVSLAETVMKGDRYKYLAQVFQSIRIAVNDELGALTQMLIDVADVLNPGGRLVIISYHSLEDKLVKAAFRNDLAGVEEDALMGGKPQLFKVLTRKAILPGNEELKSNPRSTSARLRIAEKC